MDRRTLTKLLTVTALVLVYVVIAAFDFHRELIAPIIVAAIAATLFLPFRRSRTKGGKPARRTAAEAGEVRSRER